MIVISNPSLPPDFSFVFIKYGWRGIEDFFGARTPVNVRWLNECGKERLRELRRRYLKGDMAALDEVTG